MSSCYSMYSPLSPHHNLARYCIQASCPHTMDQDMFQVKYSDFLPASSYFVAKLNSNFNLNSNLS